MTSRARRRVVALLGLAAAGGPARLAAQAPWPERTIRIVVAQAPGGPPDRIARAVAEPLARELGVPVVIENRPGASGLIGAEVAMRAPADGYTLLIATLSTHVLMPAVAARPPFDALADFTPIANLHRSIKVLWVHAGLPVRTVDEFVAYTKARPGVLNYASGGVGSSNHIDMELLREVAGIDIVHVPYNGPAAAIAAVASGEAQAMIVSVTTGLASYQGGRVRGLATFARGRSPLLTEVPTAAEAGLGDIDLTAWIGLMGPARLPQDIVARVNRDVQQVLQQPASVAWADAQGLEIAAGTPEAFARSIAEDRARWSERLNRLAIRPT